MHVVQFTMANPGLAAELVRGGTPRLSACPYQHQRTSAGRLALFAAAHPSALRLAVFGAAHPWLASVTIRGSLSGGVLRTLFAASYACCAPLHSIRILEHD